MVFLRKKGLPYVRAPDAVGNFARVAILDAPDFKYPRLRMVEQWSGKTGELVSRVAMVADHILLKPKPGANPDELALRLAEAGLAMRVSDGENLWIASFHERADEVEALPAKIAALNAWDDLVEFAEPDYLVWPAATPVDPDSIANLPMNADKSVTARFTMTQQEWKIRSFDAAGLADPDISGPDADPDADGIPNWREWLHGSNPMDAASTGFSPLEHDGNLLTFTYTRMEAMPPGYAIRAVASPDLQNWSLPITERVIARSNGIETIEASFDRSTRPKAFFSIAADQPAPESD